MIGFCLIIFHLIRSTPILVTPIVDVSGQVGEPLTFSISTDHFVSDNGSPIQLSVDSLPPGVSSSPDSFLKFTIEEYPDSAGMSFQSIFVNGNYAYATDNFGFHQFNVNDTENPCYVRELFPGVPGFVGGNEYYVYGMNFARDMMVYNATDGDGSFMGSVTIQYIPFGGFPSIIIENEVNPCYAYYTTGNLHDFSIVDITGWPAAPSDLSSYDDPDSCEYYGLEIITDTNQAFAYVGATYANVKRIMMFNITHRSSEPHRIGYTEIPSEGGSSGCFPFVRAFNHSEDQYLAIGCCDEGIYIVEITDKSNLPKLVSKLPYDYGSLESNFQYLHVHGNYLYSLDLVNEILVFDIHNITNPLFHDQISDILESPQGFDFYKNEIVVADNNYGMKFIHFGDLYVSGTPIKCNVSTIEVTAEDSDGILKTQFDFYVLESGYFDPYCTVFSCHEFLSNQTDLICSGFGYCSTKDFCICDTGYFSSSFDGENCEMYKCGSYAWNDFEVVCNQHGRCVQPDVCHCEEDYFGSECESWKCHDIDKSDLDVVCSGNGECIGPDDCHCNSLYIEDSCSLNILFLTVMTPLLTMFTISGVVICVLCCICTTLLCILVFSCLLIFSCGLLGVVVRQMGKLKKFGKLENFDLLLHEQELEQDTSIAHLRINKKIFQVQFEEIKLLSILGQGGSNSTVYLANWNNQVVAFKSFRTRSVCTNQDTFDEFEREVGIMGSVSHPNILQFYGCCLHPPRVGILMEYCENGDLLYFLKRKKIIEKELQETSNDDNNNVLKLKDRLRICFEISSAMQYLHSKDIIHRDLKLENVLMTKNDVVKIMDFGLSRIVEKNDSVEKTRRIGTSLYMPPEMVLCGGGKYDEKVDCFAFGICMYIILTEEFHPYGLDEDQLFSMNIELRVANNPNFRPALKRIREKYAGIDAKIRQDISGLVKRLWDHDPETRPGFEEVVEELRIIRDKIDEDQTTVVRNTTSPVPGDNIDEEEDRNSFFISLSHGEEVSGSKKKEKLGTVEEKYKVLEEKYNKLKVEMERMKSGKL